MNPEKMTHDEIMEMITTNVKIMTLNEIQIMISEYMMNLLDAKQKLLISDEKQKEEKLFMISSQIIVLEELKKDIKQNADALDKSKGGEEDE